MSMINWNPREELISLRQAMSELMEESFVPSSITRMVKPHGHYHLPLDAYSTEEEIVITASVPGVNPEDVEITLEGDNLKIEGEYQDPLENVEYLIQERPTGIFKRTIVLNVPVKVDEIEAKFEKGVLTLVLPKADEVRPKIIKVKAE